MRAYSVVSPTVRAEGPPDVVQTMLLAAATGQSIDWPNTTGGAAASASIVGADIVRFTAMSTLGVAMGIMVNLVSTHAQPPTSGSSGTTGTTAGSTGNSMPVMGTRLFTVPSWSTGWSAAASASGYLIAEIWSRG